MKLKNLTKKLTTLAITALMATTLVKTSFCSLIRMMPRTVIALPSKQVWMVG